MGKLKKPVVEAGMLREETGETTDIHSTQWHKWLSQHRQFKYKGQGGHFSAQKERRSSGDYWYGYRRRDGKLNKAYLGKSAELTLSRLENAANDLAGNLPLQADVETVATVPTSFATLAKIQPATLPPNLVTRTRLIDQMQSPITIISAPGGYGKSTLLNTWRQAHPALSVAWATLDADDNQLQRFWTTMVVALQTIYPALGETLLPYLQRNTNVEPSEIAAWMSSELRSAADIQLSIGLVLDNFHHIKQSDILISLQSWFAHLPAGLQLIIAGRTRPPLALGRLRAMGIVTELEQDDLRFTLAEGIDFLQQHIADQALADDELERLVKRTGGWVAGLKLAAVALNKHPDQRHLIDTFSGSHLYVREYFLETALHQQSEAVQTFLLKTSILKQLTGALCDAVTGRTDGAQMLAQLWQENLFLSRAEDQSWYQYHDLFAEMLHNQLQKQLPDLLIILHQRAANWYRQQNASADVVRHLLAISAWEEAASVIEEVVLRQLIEYGEDSRLLRWLQQLPETVFRHHKTLLFAYLRLAYLALPAAEIERVLDRLENDLTHSHPQLTQEEADVLAELRATRHNVHRSLFVAGQEDTRWQLLDGLKIMKPYYAPSSAKYEAQVSALYEQARLQGNLFVVLIVGSDCAQRAYVRGQLRQSEKIVHEVLQYALAQRDTLPEPASIALCHWCKICLQRNELPHARQLLQQLIDVDPNPTSSNMLINSAIVRAKLQAITGDHAAARATMQAARTLQAQRPARAWRDADLAAYEALFCLPSEDWELVERLLNEVREVEHPLAQLVRAEMLLRRGESVSAESLLHPILQQPIAYEPSMQAHVLLALALYAQHKLNQASQLLTEAIRLAIPERFVRPFLDYATQLLPLFALIQHTEPNTSKVLRFISEILRAAGERTGDITNLLSQETLDSLAVASSITERELEVLRLLRDGCSNRQISKQLHIAAGTVKTHLANIYKKLDVHNRVQAVGAARALKLL